jgi:hypothetical protein
MNGIQKNLRAIVKALPDAFMKQIGAGNIQVASGRSIRFDLKEPAKDGINRVKVTKDGEAFLVRFYRVDEVKILYGVPAEKLIDGIKAVTGKGL